MKTVCELNKCNGCMACTNICPKQCITVQDSIFVMNAVVDESQCVGCKLCEKVCPNVSINSFIKPIEWKQGWTKIEEVRDNSSSGGVASSIIKDFILSGGFVASCLFRKGQFIFDITNNANDALKFAGSKYVKSNPSGIYSKVQEKLKTNKVLFVGLPCQVAALKNYIKSNIENLYTIDLICHGTVSSRLLEQFLSESGYDINDAESIKFRCKNVFGCSVDGHRVRSNSILDCYMMDFLSSIDYTENCYSCHFARTERISDITLGDSWGTEYKDEEKNGVSLILVQSKKGQDLLSISDLELHDVDVQNAIINNKQLSGPSLISHERFRFIKAINKGKSFKASTYLAIPNSIFKQRIKWVLQNLKDKMGLE